MLFGFAGLVLADYGQAKARREIDSKIAIPKINCWGGSAPGIPLSVGLDPAARRPSVLTKPASRRRSCGCKATIAETAGRAWRRNRGALRAGLWRLTPNRAHSRPE
jgi:hypothetical protein